MPDLPEAHADLPREKFPIRLEAYHPSHPEAIVWTATVDAPPDGQKVKLYIPPLRRLLGHPISMRAIFGDGSVHEQGPIVQD